MQKSKEKNKVKKIRFVLLLIVVAIIAVICKIILNKSESTVSNIATNYENNETELTETLTWDISASDDDDVTATLTTDGVLTISGTGAMTDWSGSSAVSWYSYRSYIIEAIIEDGVTNIGSYAFYFYTITSIDLSNCTELTSIGGCAFEYCKSLTSIDLSNCTRLTEIETSAFQSCTSLTSIEIPESVTSIGNFAFYECTSLTSINLGDCTGLTDIGSKAFSYCTSLTSIEIPESVTSIGDRLFYYCINLASIEVDENNEYYSSEDGVLFNKDKTMIECYPAGKEDETYTIPESVTYIGSYAFYYCTSLTSIDLSNCTGLTSIGNYAFYNCKSLTSIDLNSCTGLTWIYNYAFYNCTGLTSIDLSNCTGLRSLGILAFQNCTSLTSIDLSNCTGLTSIGYCAFYNCTSLISIEIPKSVTSIGGYAFCGCTSLTSIDLSNCTGLTSIGEDAFAYCTSLTSIDLSNCTGLTSIGNYAFYNCKRLTITVIPDSVTSIGSSAFYRVTYKYSIEREDKTADEITIDLPDIIKRTLDEEDIMYANGSEPTLTNCTISYDDETMTFSAEDLESVEIYITSGVLYGMTVILEEGDTTAPSITNVTVTTNSITITAEDDLSGIVGYALTSEQTAPDESEYTSCIDSEGYGVTELTDQVVGTGLTAETTYYVWLIDGAGNVNEGYAVTTESMPELDSTTLTTTLSESDWTNEDITVMATTTYTDFTLQYSIGGTTWSEYTSGGITVTENCTIYFRLSDGTNLGESYKAVTITNIDKVAPTAEVSYSTTETTNGSVTVTITASEEIQGVSGWTLSSDGLTLTKEYTENATETVTIYDLAGNSTEVEVTITNISTDNTDDDDNEEDTKETYILYLYNGDTLYSSQEITEGDTITVDSLPTLTQSGYTFNGWADSDGNIIEEDIEVTGNITLYASWTENSSDDTDNSDDVETYTITLNLDGGYIWVVTYSDDSSEIKTAYYTYSEQIETGNSYTFTDTPERDYYEFAGWEDEEGNVTETIYVEEVTTDMTFTALWTVSSSSDDDDNSTNTGTTNSTSSTNSSTSTNSSSSSSTSSTSTNTTNTSTTNSDSTTSTTSLPYTGTKALLVGVIAIFVVIAVVVRRKWNNLKGV